MQKSEEREGEIWRQNVKRQGVSILRELNILLLDNGFQHFKNQNSTWKQLTTDEKPRDYLF